MSTAAIRLLCATTVSVTLLAACKNSDSGTAASGLGLRNQETATTSTPPADAIASVSDASDNDPLFAAPEVGDLYAGKLNQFSGVDFNVDEGKDAYGLMKVVEVHPDRVVVVTENSAWDNPRGARNDLRGDLKDITWDEEEKITIKRDELGKLKANGSLLEARRL